MIHLLLLSLVLMASVQEHTGPRNFAFHAGARRVFIDVFVGQDGRPVGGLDARDFSVLDDGVEQEEVILMDPNDYPLSAVLLLDASASVRGPTLERLKDAAHAFIDHLDTRDQVAVITFGSQYRLRKDLHDMSVPPHEAVGTIRAGGGTSVLDSLYAAIVHAEGGIGRPLLVLFSDGEDNFSWLTMSEILRTVQSSNAVVYAVVVRSEIGLRSGTTERNGVTFIDASSDAFGQDVLHRIVDATGGALISIDSASELSGVFTGILREMRSRYLLFFEPAAESQKGLHNLEVRLKKSSKATVRARKGYILR